MVLRIIHYLFVIGFLVYVTAVDDLQCRITTNVGNHSYNVANLSDNLILTCSVDGNRDVKWSKDNELLNESFIYTKSNITQDDGGKYECNLIRNTSSNPCVVFVMVSGRPLVRMNDLSQSSELQVKCFVSAYPKPEIFILKDGKSVRKFKYILVTNKTDEDQQHYLVLIEDKTPDKKENGEYTCVARNKYGTSNFTKTVERIAEQCPYFLKPELTNFTIDVGETKSLVCRVCHKSKHQFDGDIFNGPRSSKFVHRDLAIINGCNTDDGEQLKTFVMNHTIFNATKNDTGYYECTYKRRLIACRNLRKKFYVLVKEPPLVSPRRKLNVYVTVAVSVCGALVGIGLLFLVCHLRRKRFESQRFYDSMPELRWDVFVSYSSKDFLWVKVLCESLEQPPLNLTVCLHERDWELGRTVIDNMVDSVYCSHKTLIILSKHYVESSYCMQELQIAMHSELGTKTFDKERIVMIKIDGVSLKKLPRALRQKSYLDFSDNEQRKHFKTKLMKALPRQLEMIGETNGENQLCDDVPNDCCVSVEGEQTELSVMTR